MTDNGGKDRSGEGSAAYSDVRIERISAVTLPTGDMRRAVEFYVSLGFEVTFGGPDAAFTSLHFGGGHINLIGTNAEVPFAGWGRIIFHVSDTDRFYEFVLAAGHQPEAPPRDAPWAERFFHLQDPDGHELSFARPI